MTRTSVFNKLVKDLIPQIEADEAVLEEYQLKGNTYIHELYKKMIEDASSEKGDKLSEVSDVVTLLSEINVLIWYLSAKIASGNTQDISGKIQSSLFGGM